MKNRVFERFSLLDITLLFLSVQVKSFSFALAHQRKNLILYYSKGLEAQLTENVTYFCTAGFIFEKIIQNFLKVFTI